ncbi:acetylornithine deacetylase/succinyl-diaminopimelate desuccinylase-like protein [Lysobacter niastensis]|uniref:Acetylornithine deacetylase/succinyl-diaminopimelate desuccinylase-like protein n=1 Tax=Lysobacter niastensis TaxID=380629 RepID=A0ABU1W9B4_9GAMM|nr:M20/M25/M40 family metallo-hydrolase [Lysobacter niastensis]MDR7133890.1 acetylornithine deacetylase/succinyl-diaminopimelate desuccinylase-like protein [Lysobacter niastensis]
MLAPLLALGLATGVAAAPAAADFERVVQANLPEFLELLAIPNVASEPADIRRNAAFLEVALERRGFSVQQLDNPARRPLVFAEMRSTRPDAKTVLFYIHFDGQPVVPEEWAQASPFVPVVKQRVGESWQVVPTARLQQLPLDPELRVFARAASDDKAPIVMVLNAIDLLRERGATPAQHIKLLLDSEEEMSSPSLAGVAERHSALLTADALVILDGPEHASGRPTVVFGNRGIAQATLTVYGPKAPLHSGHYGNYAPNPAIRLAQLLAGMKDEDGRVLVAGYYDGVRLDDSERAKLARTPDDEPALRKRIGIAQADRVGATYQEALQYPSLNVRGLASASVGAKAANVVPSEAVAELDFRTTPETDGAHLQDLVQAHIEKQGYHVTAGPPTDDERARYPRLASFVRGPVQRAVRTPDDAPLSRWAIAALSAPQVAAGVEPVRIRMMGGTLPTDVLVDALGLPFVMVCTVNADNNQHARDENMRLGNFVSGTRAIHALLTTPLD